MAIGRAAGAESRGRRVAPPPLVRARWVPVGCPYPYHGAVGRLHRLCCIGAIYAVSACTTRQITKADLTSFEAELAVAVVVSTVESPTRVSPLFSVQDGALRGGVLPSFELQNEEVAVRVVATTMAELKASSRLLGAVSADGVELVIEVPPATPTADIPDHRLRLRAPLPASTAVLEVGDSGELVAAPRSLLGSLTVRASAPLDQPPSSAQPRAFAASERIFAPEMALPGRARDPSYRIVQLLPLTADRIIAVTTNALMIVERGQPLSLAYTASAASSFLPLSDLEDDTSARIADAVMNGSEIVAVGDVFVPHGQFARTGRVWRFEVVGGALIRSVDRPALLGETPSMLNAVVVDAKGGLVVGGEQGVLYRSAPGPAPRFVPVPRLNLENILYRSDAVTADIDVIARYGDDILLGTNNGRVLSGDPESDSWRIAIDAEPLATTMHTARINAIAVLAGEIWAVTRTGAVFHRDGEGNSVLLRLLPPPSLEPCVPRSGNVVSFGSLQTLAVSATHIYTTQKDCSAILRVRRSDDALSALAPEGQVMVLDRDNDLRRLVVTERGMLAGGDLGRLYEFQP